MSTQARRQGAGRGGETRLQMRFLLLCCFRRRKASNGKVTSLLKTPLPSHLTPLTWDSLSLSTNFTIHYKLLALVNLPTKPTFSKLAFQSPRETQLPCPHMCSGRSSFVECLPPPLYLKACFQSFLLKYIVSTWRGRAVTSIPYSLTRCLI